MKKENRASAGNAASPAPKADIQRLLDGLSFTVEGAVEAALEAAMLFEKAASYRVEKMRLRAAAEMALEQIRAELELLYRKEAAEEGDKITEKNVNAKLAIDPKVQTAQVWLDNHLADEEYAKLLLEAYRMRRDSMKAVVDLTGAERSLQALAEKSTEKLEQTLQILKQKYPGRA